MCSDHHPSERILANNKGRRVRWDLKVQRFWTLVTGMSLLGNHLGTSMMITTMANPTIAIPISQQIMTTVAVTTLTLMAATVRETAWITTCGPDLAGAVVHHSLDQRASQNYRELSLSRTSESLKLLSSRWQETFRRCQHRQATSRHTTRPWAMRLPTTLLPMPACG